MIENICGLHVKFTHMKQFSQKMEESVLCWHYPNRNVVSFLVQKCNLGWWFVTVVMQCHSQFCQDVYKIPAFRITLRTSTCRKMQFFAYTTHYTTVWYNAHPIDNLITALPTKKNWMGDCSKSYEKRKPVMKPPLALFFHDWAITLDFGFTNWAP